MKKQESAGSESGSEMCAGPVVEQELVIQPDGKIDIPWINPKASRLVLEVFKAVSDEPFPVRVVAGNLYCG